MSGAACCEPTRGHWRRSPRRLGASRCHGVALGARRGDSPGRASRGTPAQRVHPQRRASLRRDRGAADRGRRSDRGAEPQGAPRGRWALYAGEGAETDGVVKFAITDPRMVLFFMSWLRTFFVIDEARLRFAALPARGPGPRGGARVRAELTAIPLGQFRRPPSRGDPASARPSTLWAARRVVVRAASRTHRSIIGLVEPLLTSPRLRSSWPGTRLLSRRVVGRATPGACRARASSSVVKQGTHHPSVAGSIPPGPHRLPGQTLSPRCGRARRAGPESRILGQLTGPPGEHLHGPVGGQSGYDGEPVDPVGDQERSRGDEHADGDRLTVGAQPAVEAAQVASRHLGSGEVEDDRQPNQ